MARTVLLADDSVTAQNMGRRILMDAGYEVITVNNGSAALKKIHESKPDLIVLDVYMPGYGGLEVCQRLKEATETMKIPVLLTVGKMEPFKTEEAKRVRADAHIVKPFDASELLAALTKLEDRIVPSADGRGKNKSAAKKARFWHSEDPARNFDDSNTEQIAYLAEVKQRQASSENTQEDGDAPATTATAAESVTPRIVAPEATAHEEFVVHQDSSDAVTLAGASESFETPSAPEMPAPEFNVDEVPAAEFQSDSTSQAAPSPVVEPSVADAVSSASVEKVPAADMKPRWIAENVALSAEEASLELEREMHVAQTIAVSANEQVMEPPLESALAEPTAASESATEQRVAAISEPALAAAAAAGADAGTSLPLPAEAAAEVPVASDATAAWENWQHIRDSVMAPQSASALAESVADLVQATTNTKLTEAVPVSAEAHSSSEAQTSSETGAAPLSETQGGPVEASTAATDPSLEGEALASIVDSVLAELKPKLMEQIAKKLKSEKK